MRKAAHSRGQTRVVEIRDQYGTIHFPPFSWEVLLAINWRQKIFRIETDGTVTDQEGTQVTAPNWRT